MTNKVASIVFIPGMCSDDGRALTGWFNLYLNDHGGQGFWHGGPGNRDNASFHTTEADARARAAELGYQVESVRAA